MTVWIGEQPTSLQSQTHSSKRMSASAAQAVGITRLYHVLEKNCGVLGSVKDRLGYHFLVFGTASRREKLSGKSCDVHLNSPEGSSTVYEPKLELLYGQKACFGARNRWSISTVTDIKYSLVRQVNSKGCETTRTNLEGVNTICMWSSKRSDRFETLRAILWEDADR